MILQETVASVKELGAWKSTETALGIFGIRI